MTSFVRVSVNIPQISGTFDYQIPAELDGLIRAGSLLLVPFGKQTVQGVALKLIDKAEVPETRLVLDLVDPQPVVTPLQIRLAEWLADAYLAPLSNFFDLMLPPGLSQHADTLYTLKDFSANADGFTPIQQKMIELLQERGSLRGRQLEKAFPRKNWKDAAQKLVRLKILETCPLLLPPTVRPKMVKTARLTIPPQEMDLHLDELGRGAARQRREKMLAFLRDEPLPVALAWVYAASGGTLADLTRLAELGLVALDESELWRDPLSELDAGVQEPPALTAGQTEIWSRVQEGLQRSASGEKLAPNLLFGVTGSGKTEIYIRAVAETLKLGRQALVLVPEIALTPQTVRRFMARFPGQVGMVHSRLTPGERYDTWRRARAGQLPVIIGPRSALFTPLPDPGLVVVDECHDDSYYQDDIAPAYHAVDAALKLAELNHASILLGSATPGVGRMYAAEKDGWTILRLPERIQASLEAVPRAAGDLSSEACTLPNGPLPLPEVQVVDMRQELRAGNRTIFSRALETALAETLENDQQAILFLNRRGSSTYVFCRDCGKTLRCPRCDLPLTFHGEGMALVCHTCNYRREMPGKCPQCGSANIRQFGTGTEKVEAEVKLRFPQARTMRWDAETARQKNAHEMLMTHFANHHADVLVGTQMIAKGLDLPLVTLVGIVLADVGLNLPDYHSAERTFQLLTQVAGRAGRSVLGGRVILQTFQPDHYVIQASAAQDFERFYHEELGYRKSLAYPPFLRMVRLEYRSLDARRAEAASRDLARRIQGWIEEGGRGATRMIGPAPCFFSRMNGYYRWQIVLCGPDPASLLRDRPLNEWRVEVDPPDLL